MWRGTQSWRDFWRLAVTMARSRSGKWSLRCHDEMRLSVAVCGVGGLQCVCVCGGGGEGRRGGGGGGA